MAVRIRLRQQGRNNRPFYRLVVTPVTAPRDGKYLEAVGWYNPFETKPETHLNLKEERIQHWLDQGAQLSDSAQALIARGAPSLLAKHKEKVAAHRCKECAKRRARRRKAEG